MTLVEFTNSEYCACFINPHAIASIEPSGCDTDDIAFSSVYLIDGKQVTVLGTPQEVARRCANPDVQVKNMSI